MPSYVPLKFGVENHVVDMILSASPAPVTPLDDLKNEYRARKVLWMDLSADPVVDGVLPVSRVAEYVALPNSDLTGLDQMRVQFYSDAQRTDQTHDTGFVQLAELIPLGSWRVGIDGYGVPADAQKPDVLVLWLPGPVIYRSARLTIRKSTYSGSGESVALRMLMIGNALQFENNFSYGFPISFLTAPQLARTASGSRLPTRRQKKARELSLSLDLMSDSDRTALWKLEVVLAGQPFIVSGFPSSDDYRFNQHNFLGRFDDRIVYIEKHPGIHSATLPLVEV